MRILLCVYNHETITTVKAINISIAPQKSIFVTLENCSLLSLSFPCQLLIIIDEFVFSRILQKCNHRVCTLSLVLSVSIIILRFIHALCLSMVDSFLLQVVFDCRGIPQIVHSPVDGHLSCWQFGVIANEASMNTCV